MPTAWTDVIGEVWDAIGQVATTIASNAILLIPVGLMFGGAAIGLGQKLIGTRRRGRR